MRAHALQLLVSALQGFEEDGAAHDPIRSDAVVPGRAQYFSANLAVILCYDFLRMRPM